MVNSRISPAEAQEFIRSQYSAVQHTLNWYCLDYWSERLGLDICAMTTAQGPRAVLREDTVPFLDALKASGKRRILLTNAHPHNLAVKLEHTGLASHLDLLLSTHTFGYPKRISGCGMRWRKRPVCSRNARCLLMTASLFWIPRPGLAFAIVWALLILTLAWLKKLSAPSGAERLSPDDPLTDREGEAMKKNPLKGKTG